MVRLLWLLAIPCFLYLAVVLGLFLFQRSLIYPAPKGFSVIPSGFQRETLHTEDGLVLTVAWRPARPGQRTILFFHGNGDSLPGAAVATQALAQAGYGLLLADYRGYASNPGKPNEEGLVKDGKAALSFLHAKGMGPATIIIMGASIGTGVATQVARDANPAALVLVSPFTSLRDAGAAAMPWIPVHTLMLDKFDSIDAVGQVRAPTLVLHARDDKVIPFAQGQAVAKAAPQASMIIFQGEGHQLQFTPEAQGKVVEWLAAKGL